MRHDIKMIRRSAREWNKKNDPWFGKKRVTDFPNKKKVANKKACRNTNRKDW